MFLTGPGVVREVMGEDVDAAGLGGPRVHSTNGVSQFVAEDDRAAIELVRDLLSHLPQRAGEAPPIGPPAPVRRIDPAEVVRAKNCTDDNRPSDDEENIRAGSRIGV